MPKIRDLGINAIPGTMLPPGIGNGAGGYLMTCQNISVCDHPTHPQCDPRSADDQCDHPTHPAGEECRETPQCDPTHITDPPPCSQRDRQAHPGLPHAAVMQLREQLQAHVSG
jgi:hypothetical protein